MKPLTHSIPNERDRHGNSLPRSFAYPRPGISMDNQAILELVELAAADPDAARRAYPKLKAQQAVAVSKNAEAVRLELQASLTERNGRHQSEAESVQTSLDQDRSDFDSKVETALTLCAQAKCTLDLESGNEATPKPLLPKDEAIAANLGFVLPRERSKAASFLLKCGATAGAGAVFGISCGLLSGSLYLDDLSSNPLPLLLWALLGTGIVGLIGSCLQSLAYYFGEATEWLSFRDGKKVSRSPWLLAVATLLLAATFVAIESLVEKLGILRALREGQSFESFSVSNGELAIISLLLALPVVCWYLIEGYCQAVATIRNAVVEAERFRLEEGIQNAQSFLDGTRAQSQASRALRGVRRLEADLATVKSLIRQELERSELEQIEDAEFDALAADWAAEDALLELLQLPMQMPSYKRRNRLLDFIKKIFTFGRRQPV